MACTNCNNDKDFDRASYHEVCRACELLDGDKKKKKARYCPICGVYLCNDCRTNPLRRMAAFTKNVAQKVEEIITSKKSRKKKQLTEEFSENDTPEVPS